MVAATNVDLDAAVNAGRFRRDLYYRLDVVSIKLPPLRERRADIPLLLDHLIERHCEGSARPTLSPEAVEACRAHDWPGNVRELENAVEHALALAGDRIDVEHLPEKVDRSGRAVALRSEVLTGSLSFDRAVERFETDLIETALERANWVQTRAAELLGASRRVLKYKMDKYGIRRQDATR